MWLFVPQFMQSKGGSFIVDLGIVGIILFSVLPNYSLSSWFKTLDQIRKYLASWLESLYFPFFFNNGYLFSMYWYSGFVDAQEKMKIVGVGVEGIKWQECLAQMRRTLLKFRPKLSPLLKVRELCWFQSQSRSWTSIIYRYSIACIYVCILVCIYLRMHRISIVGSVMHTNVAQMCRIHAIHQVGSFFLS